MGILLFAFKYGSYRVPFLPFGSLEAFDGLQVDHLPFLSSSFTIKDTGCLVQNLICLSVFPSSACSTSFLIHQWVFPSRYK
jgi:hypothetical protein